MSDAGKFFKGVRCSAYLQGARMRQDKKTSVRYWNVTVAITMTSKLAKSKANSQEKGGKHVR